ncbi:coiled-coil domain-containing protein [Tepidimonas sp. HKU77]|uniref:coiled-coil domain-containing protein n=1 Tax=Tepidimonas sp. HKU77 TaxID=3414503 RepID=UPI003C7A2E14
MFAFDTLAFAKKLRGAGYTDAQAEALAEAQVEVFQRMLESTLATKDDINEVRAEINEVRAEIKGLKTEIGQVKTQLQSEIGQVKTQLHGEIAQAVKDMKIWFGSMLVVAVTAIATLTKVL